MRGAIQQIEDLLDIDPLEGKVFTENGSRHVIGRITHEKSIQGPLMTLLYYTGSRGHRLSLAAALHYWSTGLPPNGSVKFEGFTKDDLIARLTEEERQQYHQRDFG